MGIEDLNPITTAIKSVFSNSLGKAVSGAVAHWLPPAMSDSDKAAFELEVERIAIEKAEAATADIQNARALAMKESEGAPAWANILKVTHRPLWSFAMLGIFAWTILAPYLGYPQIPLTEVHKSIMQTVIIFYFGGRSVEKSIGMIQARK